MRLIFDDGSELQVNLSPGGTFTVHRAEDGSGVRFEISQGMVSASASRPGMWAVWRAETAGYRWVPGVGFGSWFSCALFAHARTSTTFTPEQVARVEGLEFVEPNKGETAKDWLQRQLAALSASTPTYTWGAVGLYDYVLCVDGRAVGDVYAVKWNVHRWAGGRWEAVTSDTAMVFDTEAEAKAWMISEWEAAARQ